MLCLLQKMTEAPKVVVLELEDKDVEGDVISVLNSMETIRREELVSNRIGDNKKNEYLHLAVRLASGIEALADEKTLGKMDFVVKQLDRNPALVLLREKCCTHHQNRSPIQ